MAKTEENKIFETETVTIPDFVEDKTETPAPETETSSGYSDPDLSIFKMSDEDLYDDDEDDQEESSGHRKGGRPIHLALSCPQ